MDNSDGTGRAATALATGLIAALADTDGGPADYQQWRSATLTAMADDPAVALLVIDSLAALAAGALLALDAVNPGALAAALGGRP